MDRIQIRTTVCVTVPHHVLVWVRDCMSGKHIVFRVSLRGRNADGRGTAGRPLYLPRQRNHNVARERIIIAKPGPERNECSHVRRLALNMGRLLLGPQLIVALFFVHLDSNRPIQHLNCRRTTIRNPSNGYLAT